MTIIPPSSVPSTPLLCPKAAARHLGVSHLTLADWRYRGVGPRFVKCGRIVRYELAEIEAFKDDHRYTSTTEASLRMTE